MKKSQIKKLLNLEKILEKEIEELYCETMLEIVPMSIYKDAPLPARRTMLKSIETKLFDKYSDLRNSKIAKSCIIKFVNKKYEVLGNVYFAL